MIEFTVKKQVIKVDETLMSAETLAKVLAKGLSRIVFERETGRSGGDLKKAVERITKDPEEYYSKSSGVSPIESEIKRLLIKYVKTKGLNKKMKMSVFQKTEEYKNLLKKALTSESFIKKAKENLAEKDLEKNLEL